MVVAWLWQEQLEVERVRHARHDPLVWLFCFLLWMPVADAVPHEY
jgi:hypothetical protein